MDFFGSQDVARRKTGFLIGYFALAIAGMIASLYFIAILVFTFADKSGEARIWQPELLLGISVVTIFIISIGSLYKTFELQAGGERIAQMLGGRRLHTNTNDPDERRLLNVVEEMALAAGTPVPPVYLLDNEASINAFAAGFTPGDAVIGVNRGTLDNLTRDELQGVIAHEFSHILNGDMRLNLRLVGLLHGILLLAIIGYYLMRASGRSRRGKGAGQIVLIGLAMLIIGYVGLFFARLIKAAVSRQREYLADASAVQFTRNPDGIAGALMKIGSLAHGSRMQTPEAEAASHMFFGSFRGSLFQALSTHPPLVDRIQRIDPQFDGDFKKVRPKRDKPPKEKEKPPVRSPLEAIQRPLGAARVGAALPIDPVIVMAAVGAPNTEHVAYAHNLLERLPPALTQAVHDAFSARAVVMALLLDKDDTIRQQQLDIVDRKLGALVHKETLQLYPQVLAQGPPARLPLIEIMESTLQALSPDQYAAFREVVIDLVKADQKIDLFEFTLQRVLLRHLDHHFQGAKPPRVRYMGISAVRDEASDLISALAHVGHDDENEARAAFEQASRSFAVESPLQLRSRGECSLKRVSDALDKLAECSPPIKKRVLNAATTSVLADGKVTVEEAELLRTIADSLDCPMPPLLAASAG